jgi:hypothetical protein
MERDHLKGDFGLPGRFDDARQLCAHDSRAANITVQGSLIDDEVHRGRVIPGQ